MDNQEYKPVANNLALAVKKEQRLMVIKKTSKTIFRVSWKTVLYAIFLTVANIVV